MSYFFSTPLDIDIVLDDTDDRTMIDMKMEKNRREKAPLYMDGESVKGAVTIRPKDGKRLEHTGIKVQFIGTIGTHLPTILPPSRRTQTPIDLPASTIDAYSPPQKCSSTAAATTNSSP